MNTHEIKHYMSRINLNIESNVFAANKMPMYVQLPFYLISNLDPDFKPGSHWVAIYIDVNGIGEYFDSYGRKPEGYHKMFLDRNTKRWFYNHQQLQSYLSSVCGKYCLVYLYLKIKINVKMHDYIKVFSIVNKIYNDIIICQIFRLIFD